MRALPFSNRVLVLAGAALALSLGLLLVLVLHHSPSASPVVSNPVLPHASRAAVTPRLATHRRVPHRAAHGRLPAVHLDEDLPTPLARQLRTHALVVAVIASPDETVDATTVVAAADGAHSAGAGFVLLDVRNKSTAASVAAYALGAGDPTILVVRRPGTIAAQFSGFQDSTTVAQAVLDLR